MMCTFNPPLANLPRRHTIVAIAAALLTLSGCSSNLDDTAGSGSTGILEPYESIRTRVAMRDGVELHTEILIPSNASEEPLPTLLLRTPYDLPTLPIGGLAPTSDDDDDDDDDDDEQNEDPSVTRSAWQPVLDRGYAVVFQNLRGTQTSGGRNELFAAEREDGVDTLEWIRDQSWSNGRVGAIGDSAAAFSAHLLAAEQPEGLEATFSQVGCGDIWGSAILPDEGGLKLEAFLAFALGQSLEVSDEHLALIGLDEETITEAAGEVGSALGALFGDDPAAAFEALTVQPFIDYPGVSTLLPRWREVLDESSRGELANYFNTRGQSNVPGMHVTLWQDIFVECALEDFQALSQSGVEQRLLVLDGSHYEIDNPDTWPYLPMLDWFDRHLKDAPEDMIPTVQYAVQSAESAESPSRTLVDAETWPPRDSIDRVFYLNPNGVLSDSVPNANVGFPIMSDPLNPQTTAGGRNLIIEAGVASQPPLDDNGASVSFASTPFESDAFIAGEVTLETMLTADVLDADLHARLVEIDAEGNRVLIVAGMQRARFRTGSLTPMALLPGEPVALEITVGNIAHRLAAGSRLQLELTTSDFPAWDLNTQTGGSAFTAIERRAGMVTVQGSPSIPARLSVPFLP